ncbi:MAG: ABC transporter substrate-binding protein [Desulfurococcaceae archaeon]
MNWSVKLLTLLLAFLVLLPVLRLSLVVHTETWPWDVKEEPYPWLEHLANLTDVRNIRLTILTRHEMSIQDLVKRKFLESPVARALGIVDVRFVYVAAELWPDYIERTKRLGTPIDVAWGGGPTLFNMLDEMGYLMPLDPTTHSEQYAVFYELSKIPEIIAGAETYKRDSEGRIRWIGSSVSSFGFTINKQALQYYGLPEARSWDDLTKPGYAAYLPVKPLTGIADPTMSTSNLRIFEIILQAKGWEAGWRTLTLIAANSIIYSGSGEVRDAVIRGDIAIGTTIDFYGYMAMHVNPDCIYVAPGGETIVNADPVAILKDTRYPVHAAAFVAWVLSEFGGQLIWLNEEINRIPVNPRVFETPDGAARPDLKSAFEEISRARGIVFNETLSVSWVNSVMYYFKATLVNAHSDLQQVWASIAKAYQEGRISKEWFDYLVRELGRPVEFVDPLTGTTVEFTLEYAVRVNTKLKEDPSFYNAIMRNWESAARDKYLHVYDLLQRALRGEPIPTETPTETTATQPATQPPGIWPPRTILLVGVIVAIVVVIAALAIARRK